MLIYSDTDLNDMLLASQILSLELKLKYVASNLKKNIFLRLSHRQKHFLRVWFSTVLINITMTIFRENVTGR